jgi:hypothetical protein
MKTYDFNHKVPDHTDPHTQKQKWAPFMYVGKETRFITHIFKNRNIRIAYSTEIQ